MPKPLPVRTVLLRCLALGLALLAAACVDVDRSAATVLPAGVPTRATSHFDEAARRVEPMAEALCRERLGLRGECNFSMALDSRPGQPANAFQTVDRRGRPWLVVTSALVAMARNADELAFVMGHEAAHHIEGHIPRRDIQAREGAILAGVLASQAGASPAEVRRAQSVGAALAAQEYSKEFELQADALGAEIAWRAGFDPILGAAFFLRLPDPGNVPLGSHPSNAQRRAVVAAAVARLEAGS